MKKKLHFFQILLEKNNFTAKLQMFMVQKTAWVHFSFGTHCMGCKLALFLTLDMAELTGWGAPCSFLQIGKGPPTYLVLNKKN